MFVENGKKDIRYQIDTLLLRPATDKYEKLGL